MSSFTDSSVSLTVLIGGCPLRIEYEFEDGIECLLFQVQSLLSEECSEEVVLIDIFGRQIIDNSHLQGINNEVYCFSNSACQFDNICSKKAFAKEDDTAVIQSQFRIIDTDILLCQCCSKYIDSSLIKQEKVVLHSFSCMSEMALEMGLLYTETALKQPVSLTIPSNDDVEENNDRKEQYMANAQKALSLFMRRNLLENAIQSQHLRSVYEQQSSDSALLGQERTQKESEFLSRIVSGLNQMKTYEDKTHQCNARAVVDYTKIKTYTDEIIAIDPSRPKDQVFMLGLLRWFKHDFFSWTGKPPCCHCKAAKEQMLPKGGVPPSHEERVNGGAGRCELYLCQQCNQTTRFPRYNNPSQLLKSRTGRCGEWANCFALICRALSLDARWVLDFTDHVWVEVWIDSLQRYVHADPCEKSLDAPLTYETGWNKKLTHLISFSRFGIVDATCRYTRKLHEVLLRRNVVREGYIRDTIAHYDNEILNWYINGGTSHTMKGVPLASVDQSLLITSLTEGSTAFERLCNFDVNMDVLTMRRNSLQRELQALAFEHKQEWKVEEMKGRISGDVAWRLERGEGLGQLDRDDSTNTKIELKEGQSRVRIWFHKSSNGVSDSEMFQLSSIVFYDEQGTALTVSSAGKDGMTNKDGSVNEIDVNWDNGNEGILKCLNQQASTNENQKMTDTPSTGKWLSSHVGTVYFIVEGIPSAYIFMTANDNGPPSNYGRTPIHWTVYYNDQETEECHVGEEYYTNYKSYTVYPENGRYPINTISSIDNEKEKA